MKNIIYILTFVIVLVSCSTRNIEEPDTNLKSQKLQTTLNSNEVNTYTDSVIFFTDSQFTNLDLVLKEITKTTFQDFENNYKPSCALDSTGFRNDKGLLLIHYCKDICESYLTDKRNGIKLVLPTSYDGGIIGLLFSPSCNQFIVYSSYDGPDFTEYYDHRAEIFGFTVTQGQGLKTIKPSFMYYTTDWSIANITWINNKSIALKTYEGARWGDGSALPYKYIKTDINK